jgi:hypothetical protein
MHIPPENSSYSIKNGGQFEVLVNDLSSYSARGDTLLCGDFHARTGTDLEFVTNVTDSIYYTYDNQYIAGGISCIRNNMDKVRCSRVKSLLELCIQSRLRILNGRSFGDTMGRFTAHCSLGSSVIDYFNASEDIQNKFVSFCIHGFKKSLSDLCMLSCLLKVNFTEVKELFSLGNTISLCITYQILITPLASSNSSYIP